jgi:hypothetical protein
MIMYENQNARRVRREFLNTNRSTMMEIQKAAMAISL